MKLLFLLPLFLIGIAAQKAKFYNYQLHRLTPQNDTHIKALVKLSRTNEYIYLTFATKIGRPVDVVVPPHKLPEFQEFVDGYKIPQIIRMNNYQSHHEAGRVKEGPGLPETNHKIHSGTDEGQQHRILVLLDEEEKILKARPRRMEWTTYHSLDEIYKWLTELSQKYSMVKTVVAGKTYEGREIQGIEITFGKNFTGVFIESGIHACEWIAPAGTSWMVNEILKSPKDSVFRKFNYIYIPVFNPDGYVYSWEKHRLWRKTRKPYPTENKICYGADPNRNWDFHWNEGGTTSDPCASNYPGPHAFSEVETKTLSDFIASNIKPKNIDLYIAFHSYYQLLLYPWGWSPDPAPLHKVWKRIAEASVADLAAVHGTKFQVGDSYHVIWPTSGDSGDWVYGKFNLTIPFLFEMRDSGDYGFLLPSDNIIPVGEEHLPALKRILIEYQKIGRRFKSDGGDRGGELRK